MQLKRASVKILKPWMTLKLCKRQQFRNMLYKKVKRNPKNVDLKTHYDSYSNCLKLDMKMQKENYYLNLFDANKNNSKKQWSVVNNILGISKDKITIDSINKLDNTDVVVNDSLGIANEFNMFFESVANRLVDNLDNSDGMNLQEYNMLFPCTRNKKSIFFSPTCCTEVSEVINSLNSNKSPGIDGVSADILKKASSHISKVLAFIINFSFETGVSLIT